MTPLVVIRNNSDNTMIRVAIIGRAYIGGKEVVMDLLFDILVTRGTSAKHSDFSIKYVWVSQYKCQENVFMKKNQFLLTVFSRFTGSI